MPVSAEHLDGWHTFVMAFVRYTKKEFCVIAINFNDGPVYTHINFKELKRKFPNYETSRLVIEWKDVLAKSPKKT